MFPLTCVLVVSLAFSVEYSQGQSITDVSKFTNETEIRSEEEETIKDYAEEEQTLKDDEPDPEPTDEEDNDTVASVTPKRSFGTDLELKNLTTAPLEDVAVEKLIFASCYKKGNEVGFLLIVM